MDQQFLSYLEFDITEIIGGILLLLFFVIQLFYFFYYYKKPYQLALEADNNDGISVSPKVKVSVIIVSENEVESLTKNLPIILEQDYSDFEVIVVNNGSTDESDELLQSLKLQYPNLYHTYLPYSNDKMMGRRKLALTLGVKAAKGDVLLFTEPYCRPISEKWISRMVESFSEDKDVVLGYSFYKENHKFYNRVARFGNHLSSMQYLSMAIKDKPYVGVYRNLAFRKHLFFDHKGFATLLHLENGEEIFINRIVTETNTSVVLSQDGFVETQLEDILLWRQIKRSYSVAKSYLNSKAPLIFDIDAFTRCFYYLLAVGLIVYSAVFQHWGALAITILLVLIQMITQSILFSKSTKYFLSGRFSLSIPLIDIAQPFYRLRFRGKRR